MDDAAEVEALRAQNTALMAQGDEPTINVGGVPVPLSMAGLAVGRCIRAIQAADRLIQQGFASKEDLDALKAILTGEDDE